MVRAVSAGTQNTNNKFMKKKSKSLLKPDTKGIGFFLYNRVIYLLTFGLLGIVCKMYLSITGVKS